eukprot:TRINITY_DN1445_c0_g1_i4.p1 TRINITY_DN1445_c0_g1~~TRINITY_DN1445_c0_g1_i4.p1  ORF type:complete len:559 (+),score=139.96 TRINITY_DN1445_c0_g1_i4:1381-3057(+)
MGVGGSTPVDEGDVLRSPSEARGVCRVCERSFGCLRKRTSCKLCGGWCCMGCSDVKRLLTAKRVGVRWCKGCKQSGFMQFVKGDTAEWHAVASFMDPGSINCFLQVSRETQLSLPLPYRRIRKWEDVFGKPKFIAKGSYGSVQRAACREMQDELVAVKTINKKSVFGIHKWKIILREIEIHKCLDHEYAIKLVGPRVLQTKTDIIIVMELADEDLFDRIVKRGPVPETEAKHMCRQLMEFLKYLHASGVVHRDIKPENIMLRDGVVKVADFGFTKVYPTSARPEGREQSRSLLVPQASSNIAAGGGTPAHPSGLTSCTPCGTYGFAAPELIDTTNRGRNSKAWLMDTSLTGLDVFAAGIVLHIMLTGYEPFPCKSTVQHLAAVKRGIKTSHPIYKRLSPDVLKLLIEMSCYSSALRPSAAKVLSHQWFQGKHNKTSTPSGSLPFKSIPEYPSLQDRGKSPAGAQPSLTVSDNGGIVLCTEDRGMLQQQQQQFSVNQDVPEFAPTAPLLINNLGFEQGYGSCADPAYTPEYAARSLSRYSSPEQEEYRLDCVEGIEGTD